PDRISLLKMPKAMQSGADWEDIAPVYREQLMDWNGKVLSQTMDGDAHTYTYRIDLFENAENQSAFKEKYGYDLAPPKTWKQYL
ncbi:ABC transporter substrate-binding protein, partial [Rhizobium ruizarguesonis]